MLLSFFKRYILDSEFRFVQNSYLGFYRKMSDERYIKRMYKCKTGDKLDLDEPRTFNQKLQWLKLYDRNPLYTVMVDKNLVKKYVGDIIGYEYLIPTLEVWDSVDDIDFDVLPKKFVLKCNHNSGLGMCICTDKSKLDVKKAKKDLKRGLKQDYYLTGREWPYKDVPRKIVAEKFLKGDTGGLTDYKIHCFNGVPKFVLVCRDRFSESGLTEDFYTPEWELMPVKRPSIPNAKTPLPKPEKLDEMLALAAKLSENIPFLRVDFYYVEGKIYFSELTFFPASGFAPFEPEEWDRTFGDWLELPSK